MDDLTDEMTEVKEALKSCLSIILIQRRISLWPKTAAIRFFSHGHNGRTDPLIETDASKNDTSPLMFLCQKM